GTYAAADGNPFRGTLYYGNAINTFAQNFASVLNTLNKDNDGTARPLFMASGDTDPETAPDAITAGNITISTKWLADSTYIKTTTANPAAGEGDNIERMIFALGSDMSFRRDPADPDSPVMFEG